MMLTSLVTCIDSIQFDSLDIYKVKFNTADPLALCNEFKKHQACLSAEVNVVSLTKNSSFYNTTSDLMNAVSKINYYNYQWNIENSLYPLFDINVLDAWEISKGQNVKVAIIDDGVDLDHEDLQANLLEGYDVTDGKIGGDTHGGYIAPSNHGTYCAGVIGALDNDLGVVGAAPSAKIIPIRKKYFDGEYSISKTDWIIKGLQKAYQLGADVISCSWHMYDSYVGACDLALNEVVANGRKGKGSVLVFSSANINEKENNTNHVKYPASSIQTISVGSIDKNGIRSDFSCYGIGLDVVAPGRSIPTTVPGDAYQTLFSGTSAACPHVAGVAALMLSVNPNLTYDEVREIICRTAVKLPDYTFANASPSNPYGKWNEEVGYGLVDATAAVFSAMAKKISISGPSSICREETYTIDGLPDGAEVQWIATVPRRLPHEDPIFAIPLLVKEGQGTSTVTFEQGHYNGSIIIGNTKPYVGEAVISAKITYGSASVTLTKDVYVQTTERPEITLSLYPKPDIDVDSSFITHPGIGGGSIANPPLSNMASYEFSCANLEGHEDFQWTFVASNGTQVKDGRSVIVNHPAKGTLVVTLRHKDGCPDAAIATETYTVMGLRLLATNPASGSAEMQVVWDATPEGGTGAMSLSAVPTIPYEGEYEIELWDLLRGRLMVVEGEGGYTQFPLGGIPSGNYVLRLVIDGQQMDSLPLTVR